MIFCAALFAMQCIQRRGFTGVVLLFVALAVKTPTVQNKTLKHFDVVWL
jgi:hypothetical protein